jgi:hypothetical protein
MKELSISQAQKKFTSLLSETTTIVDKKSHVKKAVLIPYELYEKLIQGININKEEDISKFSGLLSENFDTDDARYNAIVK